MARNKLTSEEVIELRYFWGVGAKPLDLAKAYSISPEAAYAHTTGRQHREEYRKKYYNSESEYVKEQRRIWQRSPKGKLSKRNNGFKRAYGITLAEYEIKLAEQNGCCEICGQHYSKFEKGLHLDHNHTTGQLRGLLCPSCNTNLVAALENPLLEKAKAYLLRYNASLQMR